MDGWVRVRVDFRFNLLQRVQLFLQWKDFFQNLDEALIQQPTLIDEVE